MKILVQTLETKTTQGGKLLTIVTDGAGNKMSVWDAAVANQLKQGQVSDVITKTVQGKDGNQYTNIVGLVAPTAPISISKPGAWKRDAGESRLIVRQNALTNAVNYHTMFIGHLDSSHQLPNESHILVTAEQFADWVLSQDTKKLETSELPTIHIDESQEPF